MIRLAIQLEGALATSYTEAARRVRGVVLVPGEAEAEALVSDQTATARGRPLLLVPDTGGEFAQVDGRGLVMPAAGWRFRPGIRAIHRRLAAGHLGAPGLLRIHRWGGQPLPLADIDLASWFFDADPRTSHVVSQSDTGYRQIHLGFQEGGMAVIDHAPLRGPASYESVSLIGSAGSASHDDHHNTNLRYDRNGCTGLTVGEGVTSQVALLRAFVEAITGERPAEVTLRDLHTPREWVRAHLA